MKALMAPVAVLAGLLALCLWNAWYLRDCCAQWEEQLAVIDALAVRENWEEAAQQTEALYKDWKSRGTWLHITMRHQELDEAEDLFCRALVLAEEEDSVEFRAAAAELGSQLRLLCEMEQVRWENVL